MVIDTLFGNLYSLAVELEDVNVRAQLERIVDERMIKGDSRTLAMKAMLHAESAFEMLAAIEHKGKRLTNQNQMGYEVACLYCDATAPTHRNDCMLIMLLRNAGLR